MPTGLGTTATGSRSLENYLGRYAGLMLYLKEMDEGVYEKLCVVSLKKSVICRFSNHIFLVRHISLLPVSSTIRN